MINKQKAWRTAAQQINIEEKRKHAGRKFKGAAINNSFRNIRNPSRLLLALLSHIGIKQAVTNSVALQTNGLPANGASMNGVSL
jgi:hypothetical protein